MTKLPRQILVAPPVARHALDNPTIELRQRLTGEWTGEDWAGKRVAVAVGSRGIDRIAEMANTVVQWLRAQGATPFIMPAMGSHGGATPEGQCGVLATYGVTEAAMLAPIEASMDVVELGETAAGVPVVVSSVALSADAVILINRVKPHTDFGSPVLGSGRYELLFNHREQAISSDYHRYGHLGWRSEGLAPQLSSLKMNSNATFSPNGPAARGP